MVQPNQPRERWGTRIGVILAVTGSAVGLGNFLRFPGLAAEYGGGVFMIPYIVAFLILGIPIAFTEWSLGRFGGGRGYNSSPGIFSSVVGTRSSAFLGVLGPLIPVMIYMYYVFVEAWCLAYAWFYLTGQMNFDNPDAAFDFFGKFIGIGEHGVVFSGSSAAVFLVICFVLNFFLIYRGLNKGIEWFCKYAMPALVICALVVLVRVLTLGTPNPELPDQSLANGLGYMWNPQHQAENLAPGDKAVKLLTQRATVDAATPLIAGGADAVFEGYQINDADAFSWALAQAGWERAPEDAEREGVEGDWRHEQTSIILAVAGDAARFQGQRAASLSPDTDIEPIRTLIAIMPRKVADVTYLDDAQRHFAQLTFEDQPAVVAALSSVGWKSDDAQTQWTHDGSRLKVELAEGKALITSPTFLEALSNPEIWLAAAGQIFFSLSVGFGIVITYSSYLRRDDDVALSSLTACAGNGFCEVALGGMITIPATFIFLGVATVANPPGTFGMGFAALPSVFGQMGAAGPVFGFLFFFLLFLAAVTSSLSMLQPAIAFLEEAISIGRKASVAILGLITAVGAGFVMYFSKNLTALDTIDFWVGNVCIYIMATIQVILFAWVLGIDRGMAELDKGAEVRIPRFFRFIIKYIAPTYLLVIFVLWLSSNAPGRIASLLTIPDQGPPIELLSIILIVLVLAFFAILIGRGSSRWGRTDDLPDDDAQSQPAGGNTNQETTR